jgi:hypothetical protein
MMCCASMAGSEERVEVCWEGRVCVLTTFNDIVKVQNIRRQRIRFHVVATGELQTNMNELVRSIGILVRKVC